MSKETQAQRVLDYMEEFGSITQFDALKDLWVMRLASRISELRQQGHNVQGSTEAVKNRFGDTIYIKRYSLWKGCGPDD